MHRKRLGKQIETAYKLFKNIHPEEFPEVLKAYQNIDIKLDSDVEVVKGFTVYDKLAMCSANQNWATTSR